MAIRYYIKKQKMLGNEILIPRVALKGSYDKSMLDMGSTITKADILAVLNNFEKAVRNICLEGNKVTIGEFMQFTPSMSGKFESELDGFDPSKHELYVTAQISSVFNNEFELSSTCEKVSSVEKKPNLIQVADVGTGELNKVVTKGDIISIGGENLKFDETEPDEYLRFVNKTNQADFISIIKFQKKTDKELVFLFPDTAITEGYFEVANKHSQFKSRQNSDIIIGTISFFSFHSLSSFRGRE